MTGNMEVEYREIPDYPGYRVGSDGSIWSSRVKGSPSRCGPWVKKKPSITKEGYYSVGMSGTYRRGFVLVHRVVLLAFVGPAPEGTECRHLDGNRLNPCLANLKWGTRQENATDRITHGTTNRGRKCHSAKLVEQDVVEIRRRIAAGESYSRIARDYGVTRGCIKGVAKGKSWAWFKG